MLTWQVRPEGRQHAMVVVVVVVVVVAIFVGGGVRQIVCRCTPAKAMMWRCHCSYAS
jgi:hypothetical protein